VERLREVIADPLIEIKTTSGRPAAPASSLNYGNVRGAGSGAKTSLSRKHHHPDPPHGSHRMSPLRAKGMQAYGIGPVVEDEKKGGAHSDDERILEIRSMISCGLSGMPSWKVAAAKVTLFSRIGKN